MKCLPQNATRPTGFTIVELMVVVAIIGILAALATPSLRDAMLGARMVAMVNDTLSDLNIARSEAVKRNSPVEICPTTNATSCSGATTWAQGWVVRDQATGTVIKATPALENTNPNALGVLLNGATPMAGIVYTASGATTSGIQSILMTFCDVRAGTGSGTLAGRRITINATGRPVFTKFTCAAP